MDNDWLDDGDWSDFEAAVSEWELDHFEEELIEEVGYELLAHFTEGFEN